MMYGINAGSRLPERVPIVTPASGVKPIEVSIDLPPSTPRYLHRYLSDKKVLKLSIGRPNNSAARSVTYL